MTPEQEALLFETLGSVKTTVENVSKDTSLLKEVINGNGHPEEGMVYRLAVVEKTQRDCPIETMATDIKDIKDEIKLNKAGNFLQKVWDWIRTNPKWSIPVILALLSTMGFSVERLLAFVNTVKEIAEKVGVK